MKWHKKINKPIIGLAPMFGYSDKSLRQKSREYGADVVYTEMVASDAIIRNIPKAFEMMEFSDNERPIVIQIFGSNPGSIKESVEIIQERLSPDGIDINFGCPVQKATKQGFGSVLLKDLNLSKKILTEAVAVANIPITIKMRLVSKIVDDNVRFVEMVKDIGVELVAIHGRTTTQKYRGHADWELIHKIKKAVPSMMILGNGDIRSSQDLIDKIGNLDGALIGRAAKIDYKIFKELQEAKNLIGSLSR